MSKPEKNQRDTQMTTVIQGHEVILLFTEVPNPQIAVQVKQALLGTYIAVERQPIMTVDDF